MNPPLETLSQPVGDWRPSLHTASEEISPVFDGYIVGKDPENGL
jgi:hypothetical protein